MSKHSRTLTDRSTPFSDTCLTFTAIKIIITFLGRNTPNNKFLDVTNKETKSRGTVVEVIYHELGAINLTLEMAAISVNSICYYQIFLNITLQQVQFASFYLHMYLPLLNLIAIILVSYFEKYCSHVNIVKLSHQSEKHS